VPSPAPGWVWQDHPAALAVAAVAGALALAGILYVARTLADTGDEPPIRVKNGSLELQLQSRKHTWHQVNATDAKHWDISGHPERGKNQIDVTMAVAPGAGPSCAAHSGSGDTLVLTYNNGTGKAVTVTIKSDGDKHTTVESTDNLTLVGSKKDRLLAYDVQGYISSVAIDSKPLCTFTAPEQLSEVVVMDYWK
jgi:hypothetical protein